MSISKTGKLEKIVQLNTRLNLSNDLEEILSVILVESEKLFDVEGTSILLEEKNTGKLYFHIATGDKKDILRSIQMEAGEGVCGYVYEQGKPLIENDPANSKFFSGRVDKESSFITRNLICVPLKIEDRIFGVLELVNKKSGDFNRDDLDFLTSVAAQASLTLERARLVKEKIQSERLATIGETIAGLSHCIKNILNGLQGGAYIVNKNIGQVSSDKLELGWNIVNENIAKISSLTLDMLSYSKEREPLYEKTSLPDIIDDILNLLEPKLKESNIEVKYNSSLRDPVIEIDPKGIYRCLLNLVSNSVDALEESRKGWIKINLSRRGKDKVQIRIQDNGCGIPEHLKDKLFSKFFSTKGSKGTGLGLPVTKKIIEEHNGSIDVQSQEGKGTLFNIILPRAKYN